MDKKKNDWMNGQWTTQRNRLIGISAWMSDWIIEEIVLQTKNESINITIMTGKSHDKINKRVGK